MALEEPAAPRQRSEKLTEEARTAYLAKDYETAYQQFREALSLRPGHVTLEFNLACTASRTGRLFEAQTALIRMLDSGVDFGIEETPDLAALRAAPEYAPVRAAAEKMRAKPSVARAEVAFKLSERDLLTEGLAFDPATGDFFVSSVHRRKILRRRPDGSVSDFIAEGSGSWGVLALRVDSPRRLLWAGTAALPQMEGYEKGLEGKSRVDAYDLSTGRLVRRIEIAGPGPHVANDLAIDPSGRVYVSDSLDSAIYRISPGADSAEVFVPPGTFRSPQGIAFTAVGAAIIVADYSRGLYRVGIATGRVEELDAPDAMFLAGIDGLDRSGDLLFVTQNLAHPDRVARLRLDPSANRVLDSEIFEWNDPRIHEPTLGVVARGKFYFIGNSQWSRFDEATGAPDKAHLEEPTIFQIPAGR
jgi:sugar lactone lactonase YvrE